MPRTARTNAVEPKTVIDGKRWAPARLVQRPASAALKASTVSVKNPQVGDFVEHLQRARRPSIFGKIPCRYLFDWCVGSLEKRPQSKGAARGKLYSILQAIVVRNLARPGPARGPISNIMTELAVAQASSAPAEKATILKIKDPLAELPERLRPTALIWLVTGVRRAGVFNLPKTFTPDANQPAQCQKLTILSKTSAPPRPHIFCLCHAREFEPACPLCKSHSGDLGNSLNEAAAEIMLRLQCTVHSFRGTLVLAFVKFSIFSGGSEIEDHYEAAVLQLFGWSASEWGKDMLEH